MADYLEFATRDVNGTFQASVRRPESNRQTFVVPLIPTAPSSYFKDKLQNIQAAFTVTTPSLVEATNNLTRQGWQGWINPSKLQIIARTFRDARDAGVVRSRELASIKADHSTPRFTKDDVGAPFRTEMRSRLAAMKPTQVLEAIMRNFELATAMAEGGEPLALLSVWTPDLYARFNDHFMVQNLASRIVAQYRLSPTAAEPLRDGENRDEAVRKAGEHIKAQRKFAEEVENVEAVLRSVVDYAALTLDTHREAAFDALMAA